MRGPHRHRPLLHPPKSRHLHRCQRHHHPWWCCLRYRLIQCYHLPRCRQGRRGGHQHHYGEARHDVRRERDLSAGSLCAAPDRVLLLDGDPGHSVQPRQEDHV